MEEEAGKPTKSKKKKAKIVGENRGNFSNYRNKTAGKRPKATEAGDGDGGDIPPASEDVEEEDE